MTTTREAKHEQERLKVEKEKLEGTRKMNDYLVEMKRIMQEYRDASCCGPFGFSNLHDQETYQVEDLQCADYHQLDGQLLV
ncbi:Transmembrane protein 94 [Bienertia sinuspersici]